MQNVSFYLGNKKFTVRGSMQVPVVLGYLPQPSCLVVRVKYYSPNDLSSKTLFEQKFDVSRKTFQKIVRFKLEARKPIDAVLQDVSRRFVMSAVLNIGWCSVDDDTGTLWRKNDFKSTKNYELKLNPAVDAYFMTLGRYHCIVCMLRR